ncbi:hypothetical protein C1645_818757 [Glomus cerebriforme]|uniref:Uncharacterized protein n=1 Tax=Glomus cerebriforme TaxID=658196 RepID=A0A397TAC9_9GLOM|nr:hypothetical protein C1645_818757 [Glomus cerebriforme]
MVRLLNDFTRVCKTEKGKEFCSCDFRINIYECQLSEFYVIVGKILVAICLIDTVIAIGSMIYLTKVKKQPFFLSATRERGWLRPRPLHSYHLIVFFFMFFEAIHLIALIYELYPNIVTAEVGNITKNTLTAAFAIFYTVSIVYSTPNVQFNDNYELSSRKNGPNTRLVDIIGIILFLQPIITWFPLAILTGRFAEMNDIETANFYFKLHYLAFVVWEIIYLMVLAYFYYKLMIVIRSYVKILEERYSSLGTIDNGHLENIKKGSRNIKIPVMAVVNGLLFQAIVYFILSFTPRTTTIYYFGWNIFFIWTEYIAFPLIAFSIESFLLYHTLKNLKKSPNSSRKSSAPSSSSEQTQVNSDDDRNKLNR